MTKLKAFAGEVLVNLAAGFLIGVLLLGTPIILTGLGVVSRPRGVGLLSTGFLCIGLVLALTTDRPWTALRGVILSLPVVTFFAVQLETSTLASMSKSFDLLPIFFIPEAILNIYQFGQWVQKKLAASKSSKLQSAPKGTVS